MAKPKRLVEILGGGDNVDLPCLRESAVTVQLPTEYVEILDSLAEMAGTDRAGAIQRLIADAAAGSC